MINQNISRLLLVSLIFLIFTILRGSLIRNFSLIYDYQLLPIKDYIITTFITGTHSVLLSSLERNCTEKQLLKPGLLQQLFNWCDVLISSIIFFGISTKSFSFSFGINTSLIPAL